MDNTGLQQILADLSAAHVALRRSSAAFDEAVAGIRDSMDGMRATIDAVAAANQAQGDVIDSVVAATEKALHMFDAPGRH